MNFRLPVTSALPGWSCCCNQLHRTAKAPALGTTFLTGILLDVAAGGALHRHWWFRLAGLSMIVAGALVGGLRRRVRQIVTGSGGQMALRPVPWLASATCAVVVWITFLMELRPF